MATHPWVFVGIVLVSFAIGYLLPRRKSSASGPAGEEKQR